MVSLKHERNIGGGRLTGTFELTRGWMGASSVFAFGDPEVDLAMLIQVKRTRNSRRIEEVRAGYRTGCKLMKKDPGPQLEAMDTINVHKKKR